MRINVAKIGMEVVDKLENIAYRIEATDEATNTEVTRAEATEILDEDDDREPKKITITNGNDRTFRVIHWVEDTALHTAAVVDGVLRVDNKDVVMGSGITVKTVLKTFPGTVVFTAETEDEKKWDAVYEYCPSRDKMTRLGFIEKQVEVLEDTDTRVVYGFSFTKEIEVKEDDKTETKTVFDRAGLYVLTKGKFAYKNLVREAECDDYDEDDEYDEYEENDKNGNELAFSESFIGFDLSNIVIAQGDKYFYIPEKDEEKDVTYAVYKITNVARYENDVVMPDKLTNVTTNFTTETSLGRAVYSCLLYTSPSPRD